MLFDVTMIIEREKRLRGGEQLNPFVFRLGIRVSSLQERERPTPEF